MGDNTAEVPTQNGTHDLGNGKKHMLLNAFDMSTIGHMSPGQWKVNQIIPAPFFLIMVKDITKADAVKFKEPGRQVCHETQLGVLD